MELYDTSESSVATAPSGNGRPGVSYLNAALGQRSVLRTIKFMATVGGSASSDDLLSLRCQRGYSPIRRIYDHRGSQVWREFSPVPPELVIGTAHVGVAPPSRRSPSTRFNSSFANSSASCGVKNSFPVNSFGLSKGVRMELFQMPSRSGWPSGVRGSVHVFCRSATALFAGWAAMGTSASPSVTESARMLAPARRQCLMKTSSLSF
jgi:hypothetical protein